MNSNIIIKDNPVVEVKTQENNINIINESNEIIINKQENNIIIPESNNSLKILDAPKGQKGDKGDKGDTGDFWKITSQTKLNGYTQTSTLENDKVYTYIRDEDNVVIETTVI